MINRQFTLTSGATLRIVGEDLFRGTAIVSNSGTDFVRFMLVGTIAGKEIGEPTSVLYTVLLQPKSEESVPDLLHELIDWILTSEMREVAGYESTDEDVFWVRCYWLTFSLTRL